MKSENTRERKREDEDTCGWMCFGCSWIPDDGRSSSNRPSIQIPCTRTHFGVVYFLVFGLLLWPLLVLLLLSALHVDESSTEIRLFCFHRRRTSLKWGREKKKIDREIEANCGKTKNISVEWAMGGRRGQFQLNVIRKAH